MPACCLTSCGCAAAAAQGLLLLLAWLGLSEGMEPFKTRPFHLTGKTKDEVAGLKHDYEHGPRGRKYSGDTGVVDAASLPLERDGGCQRGSERFVAGSAPQRTRTNSTRQNGS